MRDPKIDLNSWPSAEKDRRNVKIGFWHHDWSRRWRDQAEFRPESRAVEGSDYNQHHVDIEAPAKAEVDFGTRSDEISASRPGGIGRLRPATGGERIRGALVSAAVGDAFAWSCNGGGLRTYPWYTGIGIGDESPLIDYLPYKRPVLTEVTQLMAYTAEGLVRASGARRVGNPVDPISAVQHGFQRWLYFTRRDREQIGVVAEWSHYGGIYAPDAAVNDYPDGIVAEDFRLRGISETGHADVEIADTLLGFAATGIRSTPTDPRGTARGGDVLVRAALAAVWSEDLTETFDLAIAIAALTHPHPDDYLAAGVLAVILHQQIRDRPFMECLSAAFDELVRRPDHKKTRVMVNRGLILVQDERSPTGVNKLRRYFPDGGADGAETLGIALYCAMASDYLREGLLMALNYATHRNGAAAATGMLLGAEYGIQSVPRVFLDPMDSAPTLDTLAQHLATELRDVLVDEEWLRRFPPT